MDLNFDFDALTPRMLVDFQRVTGKSIMALATEDGFDMNALSGEEIAAVIWMALRMSGNPEATFDDALDVPLSSLHSDEEPSSDKGAADPT